MFNIVQHLYLAKMLMNFMSPLEFLNSQSMIVLQEYMAKKCFLCITKLF